MAYSMLTTLRYLIPYAWNTDWRIRARIIAALLITSATTTLSVSIPYLFKRSVNILSACNVTHPYWLVMVTLLSYGIAWTLGQTIAQIRAMLVMRVQERSARLLGLAMLDKLVALPMRYHIERNTGMLTSYIDRAQHAIDSLMWCIVAYLIPILLELTMVVIVITYLYGFMYSSALLAVMGGYMLFSLLATTQTIKLQKEQNKARAQTEGRLVDSLFNIETVKSFTNEQYEHHAVDRLLERQELTASRRYIAEAWVQLGQAMLIGSGLTYLTVIAGNGVFRGELTVGDFVMINGYLLQFVMPLQSFSYMIHQIRRAVQDIQPMIDILHMPLEVQDAPDAIDLGIKHAQVTFDDVAFGYQPDRAILKGVSFTIPAGKTLAIVGPTGSGKSTIARLLLRFYDVNSGRISVNDHDIRAITQQSLRRAIGVVPQDTVLFNDTLYSNIAYGNPQATVDEVYGAARSAQLDEFIRSLPKAYETMVGERGLKLSGGEKQRVAIARALLKRPAMYLFDEATSALDTHTEREIQKNLLAISADTTTLIIAHRLSTIVHADEIIVLDQGIVVERGTHAQLISHNGLYAILWHQQQEANK